MSGYRAGYDVAVASFLAGFALSRDVSVAASGNPGDDEFSSANGSSLDASWTQSAGGNPTGTAAVIYNGYCLLPILEHATDTETTWFGADVGRIQAKLVQAVDNEIRFRCIDIGIARIVENSAGYPIDLDNDTIDLDNDPVEAADVPASAPFCFCGIQAMPGDLGTSADLSATEYMNATVGHRGITPAHRTIEVKNTTARFGSPTSSTVDVGDEYIPTNTSPSVDNRVDLEMRGTLAGGFMTWTRWWRPVGGSELDWVQIETIADPEFNTPLYTGDTHWCGFMAYSFQTQSFPFVGRVGAFRITVGTVVTPS